ncbi:MAG: GerMN domain-containing protein [Dethiobacteria bacterium]|jgi:spore germination protein GerM/outer membrane protein assembly factor BamB|nr:GerMN domain-containing protein [Bacillota bacterium]HPT33148.1 GerMN domain-containing protein [Bacillota bacterium]
MKRIKYWHIIAAALCLLAVIAFPFVLRYLGVNLKSGAPVEPQVDSNGIAWLPSASIYDLSVDRNFSSIFLSNHDNKVFLLDRDRRPRWEKTFDAAPLQAKISSCGSFLAVGTEAGTLFFTSTDFKKQWEKDLGASVNQLAISSNGQWLAAGSGQPEAARHTLTLLNQEGEVQWEAEVAPLRQVYITGEDPEQGRIVAEHFDGETAVISVWSLQGKQLWGQSGTELLGISRGSGRLAAGRQNNLQVYSLAGDLLWEETVPFAIKAVAFNPQNFNVLIFGDSEGAQENFYYYSLDGKLLWRQRIADGSLFSFTPDGGKIVTSSWRHYKEDYTQLVVLEESGRELNRWEAAMRVERLILTGNERYILLVGEDGYLDVIDLKQSQEAERATQPAPIYRPVIEKNNQADTMVTLYFSDAQGNPVPVSRSIKQSDNLLQSTLEELVKGPARDSCLYRALPKEARINISLEEETGLLKIDLSPELVQVAGAAQSTLIIDSLLMTFSSVPGVRQIVFTSEGKELQVFGDGLLLEQPYSAYEWEQPVFIPVQSGERYYLVPRNFKDLTGGREQEADLQEILSGVIREVRQLDFIPDDLRIIGAWVSGDEVKIDLNSSARELFPEGGSESRRLQTAMILDALSLTAFENSKAGKVTVLVEGKHWSPPEGYTPLSRTIHSSYVINPEN